MALFITLLVGLFILIGAGLGNSFKKNTKFIDLSVGLALGVMVLLLILDIIPEAYESLSENLSGITIIILISSLAVGFVSLKLLDKFVPHHEHESHHHHHHNDDKCHNQHLEHVGILASIAVVIHNIIEGMTLYITATSDIKAGLLLCLAIGLHNIPLGIIISSTLQTKKELVINSFVLTISTFIGGLIVFLISGMISETLVGILLSLTSGMIIYIAFIELLPQIINSKSKKYGIIGIILGVIILVLSTLLG